MAFLHLILRIDLKLNRRRNSRQILEFQENRWKKLRRFKILFKNFHLHSNLINHSEINEVCYSVYVFECSTAYFQAWSKNIFLTSFCLVFMKVYQIKNCESARTYIINSKCFVDIYFEMSYILLIFVNTFNFAVFWLMTTFLSNQSLYLVLIFIAETVRLLSGNWKLNLWEFSFFILPKQIGNSIRKFTESKNRFKIFFCFN